MRSATSAGGRKTRLSSSANLTASPAVRTRPLPPTMSGMCSWMPRGSLMASRTWTRSPFVRGVTRRQHARDDLEVLLERADALADGREAVAVGQPLVLLPAGADADLEAAAADDVDGGGQLGGQRGVAEGGADDHVAQADPGRDHRQRRQQRERLERHLVGRLGHGVEVVEDPQRFEAEVFGLHGQLDGASPGLARIPAVVLALPALWREQSDLHRYLRLVVRRV